MKNLDIKKIILTYVISFVFILAAVLIFTCLIPYIKNGSIDVNYVKLVVQVAVLSLILTVLDVLSKIRK